MTHEEGCARSHPSASRGVGAQPHAVPIDRRVADRRLSAKLKCPACGEYLSRVVNSRVFDAGDPQIRRRRVCENAACRARFSTVERVILASVKKPA
jgi:predicted RNA-binding Zn-ribbon protein involved in translation (DUF1610 family)